MQENVIAGGLSAVQRDAEGRRVRRVSTRRIVGIDQDAKLNRALWQLGEAHGGIEGSGTVYVRRP